MGKFYSASFPSTNPTECATNISAWFNNLVGVSSEPIDYTYNNVSFKSANITIDNTDIEILFGICASDRGISISHLKNGEDNYLISDTYISGATQAATDVKLYAYIDIDCIMLSVCISNTYNPVANGIEVVYLKTEDDKYLVGYYRHSTQNVFFADISSLTFVDVADTAKVPHTYVNMYPYMATAGTIEYCNEAFFANGGIKNFSTEALKECSTVTIQSTQSLLSGICVALGAHCLAPLDTEE